MITENLEHYYKLSFDGVVVYDLIALAADPEFVKRLFRLLIGRANILYDTGLSEDDWFDVKYGGSGSEIRCKFNR